MILKNSQSKHGHTKCSTAWNPVSLRQPLIEMLCRKLRTAGCCHHPSGAAFHRSIPVAMKTHGTPSAAHTARQGVASWAGSSGIAVLDVAGAEVVALAGSSLAQGTEPPLT